MNKPTHKYEPQLKDGTPVGGHGCVTKEELQSYCDHFGMNMVKVPVTDVDKALGFFYIVPAEESA